MEAVEGLMERMKLSEAEKKGIRVGSGAASSHNRRRCKSLAKSLRIVPFMHKCWDKHSGEFGAHFGESTAKIWVQTTFCSPSIRHQVAGKRNAIEDGSWVFGKDLIVVVEFDGKKRLKTSTLILSQCGSGRRGCPWG